MPRRARVVEDDEDEPIPSYRRADTSQDREDQLISMAYDLVEERIRSRTASSQETTHFLKLGSSRERLEQKRLGYETDLLHAKKEHLDSQMRSEEMFAKALRAMRTYQGTEDEEDDPRDDDYEDDYDERPRRGRRR